MNKKVYWLCVGIIRGLFFLLYPLRTTGAEHIPADGPVILCGNHLTLLDPLAAACVSKRTLRFMAKKELFQNRLLGSLLRALGTFPVDRGNSDLAAVRQALGVLKQGDVLGIFPQGKRESKGGDKLMNGVSLIALRSGATVVPMCFYEKCRLFHKTRLAFGAPVDLSAYAGKIDGNTLNEATQTIAEAIFSLRETAGRL